MDLSVVPSGTVEGKKYEKCARCDEVLVTNLGYAHVLENYPGVEPTCTEDGYAPYSVCVLEGCTYTSYTVLEALGHDIVSVAHKDATCRVGGTYAYEYCARANCPDQVVTKEELEAENYISVHADLGEGEICPLCLCLEYEVSADETYAVVTGLGSYNGNGLIVPNSYCGLPVTGIGESAFAESELIFVVLYDNVNSIGNGAFENCAHLQTVTLPAGITELGADTFKNCVEMETILLPDDVA